VALDHRFVRHRIDGHSLLQEPEKELASATGLRRAHGSPGRIVGKQEVEIRYPGGKVRLHWAGYQQQQQRAQRGTICTSSAWEIVAWIREE